jgi:hypothetical protein
MLLRDELRELANWSDRHRRLIARLLVVLLATFAVDVLGAVLIWSTESGVKSGDIHGIGDAFFFSTVQLLTVSSQIKNPLTPAGRVVDVFLEVWAVIVVAGSAGAIAAFFQSADQKS